MTRREHGAIVGDILRALEAQRLDSARASNLTKIAASANVAFDRLMNYLHELEAIGLITADRPPALSPRGIEFLSMYLGWLRAQEDFGLNRTANVETSLPLLRRTHP